MPKQSTGLIRRNKAGIPLEKLLTKGMKAYLKEKRYFYIVSANSDNIGKHYKEEKIYKIGEGHTDTRLRSYVRKHGKHLKTNKCSGVKLHYLFTTHHNKKVHKTNSKIWKMELAVKRHFKSNKMLLNMRGTERVKINITDLFDIVEGKQKKAQDVETKHNMITKSKANPQVGDVIRVRYIVGKNEKWFEGTVIQKTKTVTFVEFEDDEEIVEFSGADAIDSKSFGMWWEYA